MNEQTRDAFLKSDSLNSGFEADGNIARSAPTTSLSTTFLDAATSLRIGSVARLRHLKLQI